MLKMCWVYKIKIKQEIVTTKEELSSFNFIRAILSAEGKDISTLNYKDTINYFNIPTCVWIKLPMSVI